MKKWSFCLLPISLFFILTIHPFLSPNRPLQANVLIVESWIPEESLRIASKEFRQNRYELIVVNGGTDKQKSDVKSRNDRAEMAKKQLIKFGVDKSNIYTLKIADVEKSRTYGYALATIAWLMKNRKNIKAVNVITMGAHARKSWILYKKAAGNKIDVGIISAPPACYNPSFWYLSWHGIGFVLKYLAGYLYALVI